MRHDGSATRPGQITRAKGAAGMMRGTGIGGTRITSPWRWIVPLLVGASMHVACAPAGAAVPDAGDLLARYDQSMGALRHSRITVVIREELAYSWKPSEWSLQEYTTERD